MTMRRSPLKPADYRNLAEFRALLRRFLVFSEQAARAAGLSPQQHQALLAIKGFPGDEMPTVSDLAGQLCIKHHSTVGLVDRLVKAGHIRRRQDESDRRRVTLTLTSSGERLLAELSAAHRRELRMLKPSLEGILAAI